jgi:hypothetical protein
MNEEEVLVGRYSHPCPPPPWRNVTFYQTWCHTALAGASIGELMHMDRRAAQSFFFGSIEDLLILEESYMQHLTHSPLMCLSYPSASQHLSTY